MARQRIEFVIRPDGTVTESVSGVTGGGCEELTRDIERSLGEVTDRERRAEFYQQGSHETQRFGEQSAGGGSTGGGTGWSGGGSGG